MKGSKLDKKYKDILSYKDMIDDAFDLDKRLAKIKESSARFDEELKLHRDKDQKKIREF